MDARTLLSTLAKLGKPQTAAIYKRHGSGDDVFGVLTSEIARLQKKIKTNHPLALELWKTGNAEARILALGVADPEKLTRAEADRFLKDGPAHFVGGYLATLVARSPIADPTMRAWMASSDESAREIGYSILSLRLKNDPDSVSNAEAERILATIEREIGRSANWARYAMNGALIAIGVYKPSLRKAAVEAARRIGDVDVDHGETHCKTPDAVTSIRAASKRPSKKRTKEPERNRALAPPAEISKKVASPMSRTAARLRPTGERALHGGAARKTESRR